MKNFKGLFFVCSAVLIVLLAQCSKTGTSCHSCAPECVTAHITYPGAGGTASQNYCGNAAQVSAWKASASVAIINQGGSIYFSNASPDSTQGFNVCAESGAPINDSVAYYSALGYSCK